jgi:hypothetical protein
MHGVVLAAGIDVDHLCRVPGCVNSAHHEPVTHKENCLRGISPAANNARKTHCKHGHEFDEANTYITKTGGRACRACARRAQAELKARRRAAPPKISPPVRTEQLSLALSDQASAA